MRNARIIGLRQPSLDAIWSSKIDHAGNPAEPFIDEFGEWPLRCCLRDSRAGEELTVVAWSPFSWHGPYAEVGPVVLHFDPCEGPARDDEIPIQFHRRRQLLRPYDHDHKIAYDHIRLVEPSDDLDLVVDELLVIDDIAVIHARNVLAGCYSFTIERVDDRQSTGVGRRTV